MKLNIQLGHNLRTNWMRLTLKSWSINCSSVALTILQQILSITRLKYFFDTANRKCIVVAWNRRWNMLIPTRSLLWIGKKESHLLYKLIKGQKFKIWSDGFNVTIWSLCPRCKWLSKTVCLTIGQILLWVVRGTRESNKLFYLS